MVGHLLPRLAPSRHLKESRFPRRSLNNVAHRLWIITLQLREVAFPVLSSKYFSSYATGFPVRRHGLNDRYAKSGYGLDFLLGDHNVGYEAPRWPFTTVNAGARRSVLSRSAFTSRRCCCTRFEHRRGPVIRPATFECKLLRLEMTFFSVALGHIDKHIDGW